jgi:hypothetical protein
MEWYEWVFAFCAACMAFTTAGVAAEVYAHVKAREPHGRQRHPRR